MSRLASSSSVALVLVALSLFACGGAQTEPSEAPAVEPPASTAEEVADEPEEAEAPPRPNCDDGTCFTCGDGICPTGAYCDESSGKPACAWLAECSGKPTCPCVTKVLGSDTNCNDTGGGPHVTP